MKFLFPVCIVGTGNKHFRSEKNSGKPSQEPYQENNFFDFRYLESFWRYKRTDKQTFTLLIGDVGSSAIIFGMKTALQQNVVIYFFHAYDLTKILRYLMTPYYEVCISGLHCGNRK